LKEAKPSIQLGFLCTAVLDVLERKCLSACKTLRKRPQVLINKNKSVLSFSLLNVKKIYLKFYKMNSFVCIGLKTVLNLKILKKAL